MVTLLNRNTKMQNAGPRRFVFVVFYVLIGAGVFPFLLKNINNTSDNKKTKTNNSSNEHTTNATENVHIREILKLQLFVYGNRAFFVTVIVFSF